MKRPIVYPGAIPQDIDVLGTNQNTMVALGLLAQATLGTGTAVDGLACGPTTPASLGVLVGPGSIYSVQNLEATSYGSLPADTTDNIVKQGIILGNTTLAITAPATSGQSQVYLVQTQYQDADGTPVVLPYYNASNPPVPYSGPANSGTPQNTVRDGKCIIGLKAGIAAATGSQAIPSPDAGYVGLWAITVANGASTIVSGNIAQVSGAPFIGKKLTQKVATINRQVFAVAGTYTPSPGLLYALVEVQGSGAGGGGSAGGGSGTSASNGVGGGAGGYTSKILPASTIGSSQAIAVGAGGGAGGAGGMGGAGASSSFGSLLTATGGSPGGPQGPSTIIAIPTATGVGGTAAGGDFVRSGSDGKSGFLFGGSSAAVGGDGGNSHLGTGGRGGAQAAGNAATGYGAGGGGAGSVGSATYVGGAGAAGVVVVTEYCSQ